MEYTTVIGIEIHARIKTKSKMFCSCSNDTFNKKANTCVCPICMGNPGMLPVFNKEALKKGIKASLALKCKVNKFSKFDRKSYFYPDLPKGYQITQFDQPLSENGYINITLANGELKKIGITRLHLEDDAGKLIHKANSTLVDFNRAGSPLMEIVSEADMRSSEEAELYARQIQKLLRYVDSSEANMERGQMRFDVNVSIMPKGTSIFGTRTETKNLNSFRSLKKAIDYEVKRQTEVLDTGGKISQETRGWDDAKEITVSQRSKEEAADYRYFPEPDLPAISLTDDFINKIKSEIPELIDEKKERYKAKFSLSEQDIEQLVENIYLSIYFEKALSVSNNPKKTANWILSELLAIEKDINKVKLSAENLGKLVKLIDDGIITSKIAKDIFVELYKENLDPKILIEKKGLKAMNNTDELESICKDIIDKNPKIVADFKGGKEKAIGGLVGQVMGATKGSANPKAVNEIIRKLLT